ncbi:MAG: hypothetical protein LVQ75_03970 [Candidatus Babeliales bacterium]|jgi:hypothetical protein
MKKLFLGGLLLAFFLINAQDAKMIPAVDGLKDLVMQFDEKAQLSNLVRKAGSIFF